MIPTQCIVVCCAAGLAQLESDLRASQLQNGGIFDQVDYTSKVNVRLPKFEMELPLQPKEILANMGQCRGGACVCVRVCVHARTHESSSSVCVRPRCQSLWCSCPYSPRKSKPIWVSLVVRACV